MKALLRTAILAAALLASGAALAAERTVTLAVDNMTCPTCPYIVKESLKAVQGVTDVEVSFETKTATVTFDDSKTDVSALTEATSEAGYPSRPAGQGD